MVLIGVWAEGSLASAENSLRELSRLAETAGSEVLEGLIQRRSRPDSATYVGAGKAAELADIVASVGADTLICDGELSPSQLRRLESIVKVKVIDRTALILDIFAQHARSREGKAQVELAQLAYMLPRLRGWGESMSRQAGGRVAGGGGIGTRGPGETKIETDRRRLRTRMGKLRREISGMATGREVQRGQRRRRDVPSVVIAGYTNAGKSEPAQRAYRRRGPGRGRAVRHPGPGRPARWNAVRTRAHADQHRWGSSGTCRTSWSRHSAPRWRKPPRRTSSCTWWTGPTPNPRRKSPRSAACWPRSARRTCQSSWWSTRSTQADPVVLQGLRAREPGSLSVSAKTGAGLAALRDAIEAALPRLDVQVKVVVPYRRGDLVARVHEEGEVLHVGHGADGTELQARVPPALAAELGRFAVAPGLGALAR